MTNDVILTWHTDPWTCGVAKFNTLLAARIGVPVVRLDTLTDWKRPLLSIKPDELGAITAKPTMPYDLLLHGLPRPQDGALVKHASRIFVGNLELAAAVENVRADATLVRIPSLLAPRHASDPLRLLSFGMAHKLTRPHFERVRELLGDRPYTVELSVAVHEGQPWGEAVQESETLLRDIFGERARLLGSLTDHALRQAMRAADWVLLFYPGGLRDNNTTFWAAKNEACRILTNKDQYSPFVRAWDINTLTAWPTDDDPMWNRLVEAVA